MQRYKQGLELWGLNLRSNNGNAVTESNFLGTIIHANTANRTYTLPDKGGTIALLSDIQAASASSAWGGITGTISDQTDLASALAYGIDPPITTSDAWDDDFSTYDTSKWTVFNAPTSVVSTDGELVVSSSQTSANTYQGVRCDPPSTSEGYTIVCAFRIKTTTNQYGNYHDAGIGFVVGTTIHMVPIYMDMSEIDYWYGNWNGGVPQYTGTIFLRDGIFSDRRVLKLVVTATSVELWSWARGKWVWLKTITTTALPTYIVLGVKHQSSSAYKTQGIFEWIKKIE